MSQAAQVLAPPVEAADLTRDFGPIRAVDSLSFRVERGEIVGLLGPNGAGKTTTLRMLTGSLIPTRGSVRLAGHDVLREGERARARLGYVPEIVPLYSEMRVAGYLAFVATMKGFGAGESPAALQAVRERLALDAVWARPIRSLSHGYRKRVGLAQALLGEPDVLILDEPTSGLDPNQIREFRSLLRALGKERAILLSTHILPEALEICDRVMILNRGKLVAMDRPDRLGVKEGGARQVLAKVRLATSPDPGDPRARVTRASDESIWLIEAPWSEEEGRQALARLVSQGASILDWRSGSGGLEDVFRRLTLGGEDS
ncbi:MAG: ABC transporter ATP-binding protein [Candidatus Eisenbacteria bacterium]|nr:ABC transporter ATP-binding protein [Candidatus Eisenbacteria bacterium]